MNQTEYKRLAAAAALDLVEPGSVLGIGTGSTVNAFMDLLAARRLRLEGAVSSSEVSTRKLQELGIPIMDLNNVGSLDLYIDGTDEFDPHRRLIKGGGAALTREKIVAAASRKFVCIADESKAVRILGAFPLPVEVIPMARSLVARKLVGLGGRPEWRQDCVTDNGNHILDVRGLDLVDPVRMERAINDLPGVVTCGLFALRPADLVLCAGPNGLRQI